MFFGAKHFHRGAYRVYGEGSVHHIDEPCDHGIGLDRHPLITREDWPSRRAYWRTEIANWWAHRQMGRIIWPDGQEEVDFASIPLIGPKPRVMAKAKLRPNLLDRPMRRLFGPPYRQVPTVRAALRPEDSVYDQRDL